MLLLFTHDSTSYLSPSGAVPSDMAHHLALRAALLEVGLDSGGWGAIALSAGEGNMTKHVDGVGIADGMSTSERREGLLSDGVSVAFLPADLRDNAVERIGLGEVGEGLAGVAHLGLQLAGEADNAVLGVLRQLEGVAVGVNTSLDGKVVEAVEGFLDPCQERFLGVKEAALLKRIRFSAERGRDGSRAEEAAGDRHPFAMGSLNLRI
jgi:hypothetical protein